jgi:hypothetical protein
MRDLLNSITQMKTGNAFPNYIDYIRFPYYRNLERDSRIDLSFPFTVFVGRNGSGKTSALQALYGAPGSFSVSRYWFTTHIDPIQNSDQGDTPCFIYAYKQDGEALEVLKNRIYNRGDPDYWETARPRKAYGMTELPGKKRNPPIKMNTIYLNFRTMISAFDKHFYFAQNFPQPYLRNKSRALRRAIDEDIIIKVGGVDQNTKPEKLAAEELEVMNKILGKKYTEGTVVYHKFFKSWGHSILFKANGATYSEAFAGSGEMAIATLVYRILRAGPNSLILLDEPETSLHPGAQKELKRFLLEQIKLKKHQMAISTHSPVFVTGLPREAIKLFSQLPDGKIRITPNIQPEEAFYEIGFEEAEKRRIIVEDKLAKDILEEVLKIKGTHTAAMFDVVIGPGGAQGIVKNLAILVSTNLHKKQFALLDGDQKQPHVDTSTLRVNELTKEHLDTLILQQTGSQPGFLISGSDPEDHMRARKDFLDYYKDHVQHLPKLTPEEIIWDDDLYKELLENITGQTATQLQAVFAAIDAETNFKEKFRLFAEKVDLGGSSGNIHAAQILFLARWKNKGDQSFQDISAVIDAFKNMPI